MQSDDTIPLDGYVVLGREWHLRGYAGERFRDRYAWWAGAEYRFPLHHYLGTGAVFSALFFLEAARAGDSADELFGKLPRWSLGAGVVMDTALESLFRAQIGFSPEGVQFTLSLGVF